MIDKRPRKRRWARWAALVLLVGGVGLAAHLLESPASAKPPAAKSGGGKGGDKAAPLLVDVVTLAAETHTVSVAATGELLPAEAVDVVSELSRRLVRVRAEEGARVAKGDVLFEVDASDLYARRARLVVARDLNKRILARREAHAHGGAITAHELDVGRTEVAAVEAEIREVDVELDKTRIRAPFDGVLGTRNVSVGAWVTASYVLTTLYDTSRFKLDFTLSEHHAAHLVVGGTFTFATSSGQRGQGKIAVIEPSTDTGTRSLRVRGLIDAGAATGTLVAGSFASVKLTLAPRQAIFAPSIAVEASPQGHSLWLLRDGKAERRSVTIGERTPERMEVTEGVAAGDAVIITNLLRLKDGVPVRTAP